MINRTDYMIIAKFTGLNKGGEFAAATRGNILEITLKGADIYRFYILTRIPENWAGTRWYYESEIAE